MAKKYNFIEGLQRHWDNSPLCQCLNCKKYAEEKKAYLG